MDLSRRQVIGALAGTVVASAVGRAAPASAAGTVRPVPFVYDSDLDFDDASTLAYLCQEHRLGRIDSRTPGWRRCMNSKTGSNSTAVIPSSFR